MWALVATWCTPATLFVLLNVMIGTIALTSRFAGPRNDHQRMYQQLGPGAPLRRAPSLLERVKSLDFSVYRCEPQPPPSSEPEVYPQLVRAPSLLERVRSFNFSLYAADKPPHESAAVGAPAELHGDGEGVATPQPQLSRAPSLLERVKSIKLSFHRSDPFPSESTGGAPDRDGGPGEELKPESERKRAPATRSKKLKKSMSEKEASGPAEDADAVERRRPQTTRETKSETISFDDDDEEVDAKADDFINRFKQQLKLQRLDSLLRYSRGGGH